MPTTQEHTQSIDSDPEAHSALFKEIMESIEVVFTHFSQPEGFLAERLGDAMRVLRMNPTEEEVRKHLADLGGPQYIDERTFHHFIKDELIKHFEKVQVVVDYLKQYDKDGKGALSREELQEAMRGRECQELQASVAKVPSNSQGHLDIVELAKCFLELSDFQDPFQILASTDAVFKYFSKPCGVPAARLGHAMRVLGMNPTEDEVEKRLTDLGRPEYIDQNVFHNLMEEELGKPIPKVQELLDYLKQFDKDGKGALSKEELQEVMRGSELSPDEVQASLRKMPRNSDGHLDIAKLSKYFLELGGSQVGTETARRDVASRVREAIVRIAEAEAQYDLKDAKAFAQFLQDADVRLVRARYLTELVRSGRPLPRRQELESKTFVPPNSEEAETALVSHQEVQTWAEGNRDAIICSISHAWETREHPDPCRYQLEHIVQRVVLYEAAFKADVWVFYDYASLFQFERFSPEEQNSFGAAMQNMHVMYAHEHTLTLRIESLTPDDVWNRMMANETELVPVYDKDEKNVVAKPLKDLFPNRNAYTSRGWCMAEVEWSSLRTVNLQHQRIDGVDDHSDDGSRVKLNGRIPMTPAKFRSKMEEAVFTHRSDAESVIRLQAKIFFEKVTVCEHLELEGLPADQVLALAHALPLYKNLKSLVLKTFRCDEEQVEALAKAFATSGLQMLTIDNDDAKSTTLMVKAFLGFSFKQPLFFHVRLSTS
ncbi:unnamed protein product [Cladocopium goreaui]|uniref:Calmodulin n=1 Tax=Cladocopium goreaui TaxID=2562237 RepID=A0A9P1FRG6_9DINO|nr:unnamed protein product [Cladocopium goreaui]